MGSRIIDVEKHANGIQTQEQDEGVIVFSHPLVNDPSPPETLVGFDGPSDPYHPLNWPTSKKILMTILYGTTTCWITFATAVFASGIMPIAADFGVTSEVPAAGVSLILFGFALGSMIWAPLSELYGRKYVVILVCFEAVLSILCPA